MKEFVRCNFGNFWWYLL